jgi:alkanesulfonate monooxygenase SsuD/methylene tetrahydromethanopterin reductase-like flavin-dependent oxidoreductase (luciferase family)
VLARGYRGFDPEAPLVGTADRVAAGIAELAAMGYTDVIVRHLADDQRDVLRSLEHLAQVRGDVRDL